MKKHLVIVEPPSKSKTIEKYLGKDYRVVSSKGHVCDLATSGKEGLGIDVEHDFEPKYKISKEKKEVVKPTKTKVKPKAKQTKAAVSEKKEKTKSFTIRKRED